MITRLCLSGDIGIAIWRHCFLPVNYAKAPGCAVGDHADRFYLNSIGLEQRENKKWARRFGAGSLLLMEEPAPFDGFRQGERCSDPNAATARADAIEGEPSSQHGKQRGWGMR